MKFKIWNKYNDIVESFKMKLDFVYIFIGIFKKYLRIIKRFEYIEILVLYLDFISYFLIIL